MFKDLQDFLRFLEKKGDLKRIKVEVDPHLEITEIVTRVAKEEGPALLFENIKGSSFPIAVNILGASRRIEWALGRHPKEIGEEFISLIDKLNPPSLRNLFSNRKSLFRAFRMRTKAVSKGQVQEMEIEPNFNSLPIVQCWPEDGGRFITFGMVLTKDPISRERNVGVYRMQIYDEERAGMHWQIQKGGGFHYDRAEKSGKPLEAMVVFGGDPTILISAITPLPEGFDELAFNGFLRGSPTTMIKGTRIQEDVPAHAEFILEGIVPPNEREMEGPFGDHFGHYSHRAPFPVFHLKAITHRRDPVFPTSIVGKPPQEDKYLGEAVEEMTFPLLRMLHPEIKDGWAYFEAGFHNLLVISVVERYEKEGMKTALGLMGTGQLSLSKCIVLVSEDVNVRSFKDVLGAIRENFNPENDFLLIPGVPLDTLDFTSFKMNLGSKMVIDATKNPESRILNPASRSFKEPKEIDSRIKEWRLLEDVLLVVKVEKDGREVLEKLVQFYGKLNKENDEYRTTNSSASGGRIPKIISTVSEDVPLDDETLLLWGIFTRFDCARDICFTSSEFARIGRTPQSIIGSAWPIYKGILGVDATFKKGYPQSIVMSTGIIEKVDRRWEEYGI
jgi:4-hydroxy-3-polyprenylbenzoate decarboxylase